MLCRRGGERHVEDGHRPDRVHGGWQLLPPLDGVRQVAVGVADLDPGQAAFQREVQPVQGEGDGDGRRSPTDMLGSIRIDAGLMPAAKLRGVSSAVRDDLAVDLPTLR
jgi:hypothetical protein